MSMSSQESAALDHLLQTIRYSPSKPRFSLSISGIRTPLMYDILNQSCVRIGQKIAWGKRDSNGLISGFLSGCIVTPEHKPVIFVTDLVQSTRSNRYYGARLLDVTFFSDIPAHLDIVRQILKSSITQQTDPSIGTSPIMDTSSNTIWNPSPAPVSPDPNIQPYLHISNTSKHECPECHSILISKTRTYFSKSGDILFWDACCGNGHYIVIENK